MRVHLLHGEKRVLWTEAEITNLVRKKPRKKVESHTGRCNLSGAKKEKSGSGSLRSSHAG